MYYTIKLSIKKAKTYHMEEIMKKNQGEELIRTEFCVVGGGMSGICAAVSAARRGVKVVLLQDRPVLGGNASSEIRMWIRGVNTSFPQYREGGILEEIAMDNIALNPKMNFSLWDGVIYNKVISEKNITLLLNTSCIDAEERDGKIVSVLAWQLTSYKKIRVEADYFADCSGDCVLSEFTGALCRKGREDRKEYGESYAPEKGDGCTMGNSCLIQIRETDDKTEYIPPEFAYKFSDEEISCRMNVRRGMDVNFENFWWLETGGVKDTVRDAEEINRMLIAKAFGAWDYIKNSGRFSMENWELDWVGFLAGKRESRRYVGDYTLTQNDIESPSVFEDEVAYGGWSLDDHNPLGIETRDPANVHYPVKAPYSIPYRCLYSKNTENLYFAGRNVSVTHMALSSTRVMATCALMGQAVGTACALAVKYGISARGVGEHIGELKQNLRDDDCFLLHTPRKLSAAVLGADLTLSPKQCKILSCGIERKLGEEDNVIQLKKGEEFRAVFKELCWCERIRIVFDNDIAGERYGKDEVFLAMYPNRCNLPKKAPLLRMAPSLVKKYRVDVLKNGQWETVCFKENNHERAVKILVGQEIEGIRFIGEETYGSEEIRVFSLDICN